VQGDLWQVVEQVGPGGALLSLPLLASASLDQDAWSLGLFGEAWWIVVVTSLLGCVLLVRGLVDLFRMFRRWSAAVERGHGHRMVAMVITDRARTVGFLFQGARAYSILPVERRDALLTARIVVGVAMLFGTLWLSVGFAIGALAATRGWLSEVALAYWTFAPMVIAFFVAVVIQAWENNVVRAARREWYRRARTGRTSDDEIGTWLEVARAVPDAVPMPAGSDGTLGTRFAAGVTALACLVVPGIGLLLTVLVGVGPILTSVALPDFQRVQTRAAVVRSMEGYRLPADPSVSPMDAGEAMMALASVSGQPPSDLLRGPVRSYEAPIFPEDSAGEGGPTGLQPGEWAAELMPRANELDSETVRFLAERGSHPALAEISVLARARGLDEAGGLWVSPLPPDVAIWELPIPRYRGLRDAVYAHIGGAVAEVARNRDDAAEMRLREVISMGLLMADEGSTVITNLVGMVMARQGAEALIGLYEGTGRSDDALALRGRIDSAERAAEVALVGIESSTTTALQVMPLTILDDDAVRGRRWESFMLLNTVGPCANLNRAVFGVDESHQAWIESARAGLVRTAAEESLFEAARVGYFSPGPTSEAPMVERVLRLLLGEGESGSCATAVGQMLR
jgi:hypothetical protein